MADIILPSGGQDNWGEMLNAAVSAINDDLESTVTLAANVDSRSTAATDTANAATDTANAATAAASDAGSAAASAAVVASSAAADAAQAVSDIAGLRQSVGVQSNPAPIVATIGDSITTAGASYTQSFAKLAPALAGDHTSSMPAFAAGGYKLQQIHDAFLPSVLAMNPLPKACLIAGGTDDMISGFNVATLAATLKTITDALQAAGITPILWAPPPRSAVVGNATANGYTTLWSAYIRRLGSAQAWPVLDAQALLSDPTTGGYATKYIATQQTTQGDGIHPNCTAHVVLAKAYADIVKTLLPFERKSLITSPLDPAITSTVGLFLTDTNSDGIADGVVKIGSPVASLVAGPYGNWQRNGIAAAQATGSVLRVLVTGLTAGHVYQIGYMLQASLDGPDGGDGGGGATGTVGGMTLTWLNASNASTGPIGSGNPTGRSMCGVHESDGPLLFDMTSTAPALTTQLRADLGFTGAAAVAGGYVQMSQFTVRDLTALGLA